MKKIYIARHGQDEDNAANILNGHRDQPLTDQGVAQAKTLGRHLREHEIAVDHVLCSPLQRVRRTAEIACEVADLPSPEVHPLLIERDFGIMAGTPVTEIAQNYSGPTLQADPITYFLEPADGETFPENLERCIKYLQDVEDRFADKSILSFTHGDTGKMLFAAFYGIPWQDVLKQFHFGNGEVLILEESRDWRNAKIISQDQHNH